MAAGRKGAPLVPYVDYLLFRHAKRGRVALNIGGIANITAIPPGARPSEVMAFDTGSGNMAIDALVAELTSGRERFDRDGQIAARGREDRALLDRILADRYYREQPPKTAGREQYGAEFIARRKQPGLPLTDLTPSATGLTAGALCAVLRRLC